MPFGVQVKIAGFIGIALAMPVILFQVWRFVTPGPHASASGASSGR